MTREKVQQVIQELRAKKYSDQQISIFIKAFQEKKFSDSRIDEVVEMLKQKADATRTAKAQEAGVEDSDEMTLERLVALVSDSEIASIQNVTTGIINIINDPSSTVKDLRNLIEIDPALTSKVLRIANSAQFFSRIRISDIERAVMWIGFENLKEISLNQKVCEIFKNEENEFGFSQVQLWKHCVAVALLGKMIYRREFGEPGENVYAAGLLHDIGIISENQFLRDDFADIIKTMRDSNKRKNLHDFENEKLGFNHAEIGREISRHWDFPPELYNSIGFHHSPLLAPAAFSRITCTLYVTDYMCHANGIGYCVNYALSKTVLAKCLDVLDVKMNALEFITKEMLEEIKKMEEQGLFDDVQ